jgi:hypothetical protein
MSQKQSVLLLSGYNIRAVIAFCRWATAHNVNFHIIARDEFDPIFLTDYKKNILLVRDSLALQPGTLLAWVDALNGKHRYDRVLLLPVSEYFNRFLLQHREEIEGTDALFHWLRKHFTKPFRTRSVLPVYVRRMAWISHLNLMISLHSFRLLPNRDTIFPLLVANLSHI